MDKTVAVNALPIEAPIYAEASVAPARLTRSTAPTLVARDPVVVISATVAVGPNRSTALSNVPVVPRKVPADKYKPWEQEVPSNSYFL